MLVVYILPQSINQLVNQLFSRDGRLLDSWREDQTESEANVQLDRWRYLMSRWEQIEKDLEQIEKAHFVVINKPDGIDDAVHDIDYLAQSFKARLVRKAQETSVSN